MPSCNKTKQASGDILGSLFVFEFTLLSDGDLFNDRTVVCLKP